MILWRLGQLVVAVVLGWSYLATRTVRPVPAEAAPRPGSGLARDGQPSPRSRGPPTMTSIWSTGTAGASRLVALTHPP